MLDFGSGSGVLAIAAAKAGAKKIIACDLDPLSLQAIDANAQLNQVKLELLDDFFNTKPVFFIVFILLGVAGSVLNIYKLAVNSDAGSDVTDKVDET